METIRFDFAAAEKHGVHAVRELAVLRIVRSAGDDAQCEVRNIAAALGVSKAAVTRAFDALCNKGFAHRHGVVSDRRLVRLLLTDKGFDVSKEIFS